MQILHALGVTLWLLLIVAPGIAAAETCSERRAICLAGERSRGYTPPPGQVSSCVQAYPMCLKTGVWQTEGPYGRRIEGMTRR
jgi:hypothetical protein